MVADARNASHKLAVVLAALALSSTALAQSPPAAPPPSAPAPDASVPSPTPPPSATAPPSAPPPSAPTPAATRADALFQEGKRLLELGSFAAACDLLAQSDTLDPSVSALGLLATCHEQQGRLATAWREYVETAKRADAAHDERGSFAKQRAAAIEPRVPRMTILVPHSIAGLTVHRDGAPVRANALGTPILVDPGAIELAFSAPGHEPARIRLSAKESSSITIDAPELARVTPPAPPAPPPSVTSRLGARLPAAIAIGGVGIAALGVGIGFGAHAIDRNAASKTLQDLCASPGAPQGSCAAGQDARQSAFRGATISTVGFVAGGVGIGVAAALLLWPTGRAPAAKQGGLDLTPLLGTDGAGASLRGSF